MHFLVINILVSVRSYRSLIYERECFYSGYAEKDTENMPEQAITCGIRPRQHIATAVAVA